MGEEHALIVCCPAEVILVRSAFALEFRREHHIEALTAQIASQSGIRIVIEIEPGREPLNSHLLVRLQRERLPSVDR